MLGGGGIVGLILIKTGTTRPELNLLYVHIALCLVGVGLIFADWLGNRGWLGAGAFAAMLRTAVCLLALVGLAAGAQYFRTARWLNGARIENPPDSPASMEEEGDGSNGPFFPSSAQVYGGQKIPEQVFHGVRLLPALSRGYL